MPHDLKLSPFSPQKKQLKATLIFTKHSYMHTWKHRCKAVGLMTKTDLTTFVHRGQDPRSGPDLMTCQLQPSISQLDQPLCSTDNSWHSPTWMPRSGGKAVSARGGGGVLTLSYGVRNYSQFPCLCLERRNRLRLRLCRSLLKL